MEKKKPTVTIAIPAYNEAENIGYLLEDLVKQKNESYVLEKILVISDGSTDTTVHKAQKISSQYLTIIAHKQRLGIAARLNEITMYTTSDILVILNADIAIDDPLFVEKLISPIRDNEAHLTSCPILEIEAETFLEKVLATSMHLKEFTFKKYRAGDNVYTCHGPARAFAKVLYKTIYFPTSIGEDGFSYLYCKFNKLFYRYVDETYVTYKLPSTMKDHKKQSSRFLEGQDKFKEEFGEEFVKQQYRLPKTLFTYAFLSFLIKQPVLTVSYVFMYCFLRIKAHAAFPSDEAWDIAASSKQLRTTNNI